MKLRVNLVAEAQSSVRRNVYLRSPTAEIRLLEKTNNTKTVMTALSITMIRCVVCVCYFAVVVGGVE